MKQLIFWAVLIISSISDANAVLSNAQSSRFVRPTSYAKRLDLTKTIFKNGRMVPYYVIEMTRRMTGANPNFSTDYYNWIGMSAWGWPGSVTVIDSLTFVPESSDWVKEGNSCYSGLYLGQPPLDSNCDDRVRFTPSRMGVQRAESVLVVSYYKEPGGDLEDTTELRVHFVGSHFYRPPRCSDTVAGSIVRIYDQSLGEVVPIVGVNFNLFYSSSYSAQHISSTASLSSSGSFNLEGWTPSIYHYYDKDQLRLYLGTGEVKAKDNLDASFAGTTIYVTNGDEVYYFNRADGRILETRSSLTGALKYSFGYDSNSRLISITDRYGSTTLFTRNSSGKVTAITSPEGHVTTININADGLISSVVNPKGETYAMTYKSGTTLLETYTKPGGQTTTFNYNGDGKLTQDLGHGGSSWSLAGTLSNLTLMSNMGRTTQYTKTRDLSMNEYVERLEPSGQLTSSMENSVFRSSLTSGVELSTDLLDDSRLPLEQRVASSKVKINAAEKITTYDQFVAGSSGLPYPYADYLTLTKTKTTNGKVFTSVFNNLSKSQMETSPLGATKTAILDMHENIISMQTGTDLEFKMTYDIKGRLESSYQGVAHNQRIYSYNSSGWLQSVTNALSEVTSYAYDLAGRVASVTLPDMRVIQYGYDLNGNITSVTPPSRPVHNFTFNAMELLSQYQPPTLSGVLNVNTQYAYNMDRQLTQITRPSGDVANFNYNATTGLLSSLSWSGGTRTFSYHPNTDLVSRVDMSDGNRSNYTYYGRNILTEEQRWISGDWLFGKIINTYDSEHRFSGRTVQGNASTNYSSYTIDYNNDDKPSRIGFVNYTYEYPSGRLSSTTMDTVSDAYTYDTYGNLSGYSATYTPTGSGTPQLLYSYTLTRDAINRITGKSETIQGVSSTYSYSYDNVGRLTGVIKDGLPYSSYTYDSNSNRISGMTGGVTFAATYDNQDRLITYGSKNYTYSSNGDLSHIVYSDATSHEFWFDAFGNIQYIKRRDGSWETYYTDGKNRLFAGYLGTSLMHRRIYQGDYRIAARLNDSGVMSENYVYGSHISTPEYIVKGGYRQRVIRDHLGSPRLVIRTADGVVSQRMDYNEFGEVINDTNPGYQPYGFAGGIYFPSTKMVKFGARLYDAAVGRWLSKDPILFGGGDTNLYGYVANDPVNWIDPDGLKGVGVATAVRRGVISGIGVGVAVGVTTKSPQAGLMCGAVTAVGVTAINLFEDYDPVKEVMDKFNQDLGK